MAADNTSHNLTGAIQKYFTKESMGLPKRYFDTPLNNSSLGISANIPKHQGTHMAFRRFSDLNPTRESADDSPKLYKEGDGSVSSGRTLAVDVDLEVPIALIDDYISLGHILQKVDPIEIAKEARMQLQRMVRRTGHMVTNDAFVKGVTDVSSYADGSKLPGGFKTIYGSGAKSFGELTEEAYLTVHDVKRAVSILRNGKVPPAFGDSERGLYAVILDDALWAQLEEDKRFREVVDRGYMTSKAFGKFQFVDVYGARFICQTDSYRCNLATTDSGALTTRKDTGAVHVAHVLGRKAFAYLGLDGKHARQKFQFKVQDITPTGTDTTIGFNIPCRAAVVQPDFGINIAACTAYDETTDDLADN